MSYSRRQLYALGETFGDSATRMEVGGRIVYGGGGGGGGAPEPTTKITESGPATESRTTTSSTNLPGYINANSENIVGKARTIGDTPYQAFTGQRVAEFSPDMLTAMERMRNQGVAGQTTEASGLASLAGQRASDYGMFNQGVQQFMNPYMQNVVDVERRKAQENADRQSAMLSGQAAKTGAFGGSGAALQQRALTRDTAQQLADLQTQGLDRAYQSAVGQYNTGISNTLAASGQLAGLGRDQFGQETDLIRNLGTSGDIQRQREQALLDVGYGDFTEKRDYAAKQLALQKALSSGLEYDTSTTSSSDSVSQPGKTVTQTVAAGGEIRSYAGGGIASLSDQQIAQRKQMPISELARLALQAREMENARLRADQQNMDAQQAMMAQGPTTVYDDEMNEMRRIAAARESGIAGLDGYEYSAAGGGIVAFFEGEEVPAPFIPTDPNDNRFKGTGPILGNTSKVGIEQLVPGARKTGNVAPPAPTTANPRSNMLDDIYNPIMDEARAIRDAERKGLDEVEKDIKAEAEEGNSFTAKARERINARLKGLEGEDKNIAENSILKFGFGFLAASGEKNKRKAFAELGLNTLTGHEKAIKDLQAKQKLYEDAELDILKVEMGDRRATNKELRELKLKRNQAEANLSKSLVDIMGDRGAKAVELYKARLTAGAGSRSSEKERLLEQLAKFPAGTEKGDQLRQNLEYLGEVGKPDPALKDPNYKKKADLLGMLEMRYSATTDPKIKAQLESDINNTKIEMAGMLRPGSGSVGGGGSGTLNAADQALLDKYR